MRIYEIISEKKIPKPTKSQCAVKRLSNVRYSQCVSLGLKAHDSDHTDGTGKQGKDGSGTQVRGKSGVSGKSVKYGGRVKNYGGEHS